MSSSDPLFDEELPPEAEEADDAERAPAGRATLEVPKSTGGQIVAAVWLLFVATVLFRLPALLNARGLPSDTAVVGLQARHLLRGEWFWYLWGPGYQGVFDALLAALAFKVAGATPLMLMLVPLVGHLLLEVLTFDMLQRRVGAALGLLATLPVIFTPHAINEVAAYAPRQWCITFVFVGLWLLDGASHSRRPLRRYALGALMGPLALYLDMYALRLMPGFVIFALACCADAWPGFKKALSRAGATLAGGGLAALALLGARHLSGAPSATAALSLEPVERNARLLWETCLPWLLGYGVYVPGRDLQPDRWEAPLPFALLQKLGAALLVLGIAMGLLLLVLRRLPWDVRRLGLLGAVVSAASVGGFLVSALPADMGSAHSLAPIVWFAPFALAPVALLLRPRRFALGLAPYIAAAAVGGWVSYGSYVDGSLPRRDDRGLAREEMEVARVLRERKVTAAAAPYSLAYRLAFLFEESPVVMPLLLSEDRYRPYRDAFDEAKRVAFIFHPSEPQARPEPHEEKLRQQGARYERQQVAGFTLLIVSR